MTKGQDTRQTVLSAALSLASEVGLAGMTIGKLSQACGMSKSGLFAHFSSKENLQVELLQEAVDRFVERVVTPGLKHRRGEPRVRALFDNWLGWSKLDFMPGGCIFMAAAVERAICSSLRSATGSRRSRSLPASRSKRSSFVAISTPSCSPTRSIRSRRGITSCLVCSQTPKPRSEPARRSSG